jgi:hypothetical protein
MTSGYLSPASSAPHKGAPPRPAWLSILAVVVLVHLVLLLAWSCRRPRPEPSDAAPPPAAAVTNELGFVRAAPARFPPNTTMPDVREVEASGAIHMPSFSPGRDLVFFDDPRVWWESDEDGETDDECDHSMYASMVLPLRRVIEAVAARQGVLKVQDIYRPTGIHNSRSLHKEGRAIDLTCEGLTLEELAIICWQSGFDWVYYERPKGGGDHIHASVRR